MAAGGWLILSQSRQMLGERLAGGTVAIKSRDRGLRSSGIRLCPILLKVRLEVLKLHFELLDSRA